MSFSAKEFFFQSHAYLFLTKYVIKTNNLRSLSDRKRTASFSLLPQLILFLIYFSTVHIPFPTRRNVGVCIDNVRWTFHVALPHVQLMT